MNTATAHEPSGGKLLRNTLTALPVALVLLCAIVFGTSSSLHSQMLALGQSMWSNYGMLRSEMRAPTCDPDFDVEARVKERMANVKETAEDDLLNFDAPNPDHLRRSLTRQKARCLEQHQLYEYNQEMRSAFWVRAYTASEQYVGSLNEVGDRKSVV